MIKEFEFFHGLVLARILHATQRPVLIRPFRPTSNASYVLNNAVGLYIKYSAKRMTPWRFTFLQEHQDEIDALKKSLAKTFLTLVCNDDGIVCLEYSELKAILDHQHKPIEWISVTRRKNQMYSVKGSDGQLDFKVGKSEFPAKLFKT